MDNERFYIDDVIKTLVEMRKDGFRYCSFLVLEAEPEAIENGEGGDLIITADWNGGTCGNDYPFIRGVETEEIENYAYANRKPAPWRDEIDVEKLIEAIGAEKFEEWVNRLG